MRIARRWCRFIPILSVGLAVSALSTGCEDLPLPPIGDSEHRNVFGACDLEVFVLRGLADTYSLGFNHLCERLQNEGIESDAMNHTAWWALGEELAKSKYQGVLRSRLAVVGHSYGGDDAIRLAELLRTEGITVDLLVLFDSTNPPPVPDNVRRVVHFYQPTPWGNIWPHFFAGQPVRPDDGNETTEILNVKVSLETFGEDVKEVNHFNMDSSDLLHDLTVEEILGLCTEIPSPNSKYGLH